MGIILAFIAGAGIKNLNLGIDPILINIATIFSVLFLEYGFLKNQNQKMEM